MPAASAASASVPPAATRRSIVSRRGSSAPPRWPPAPSLTQADRRHQAHIFGNLVHICATHCLGYDARPRFDQYMHQFANNGRAGASAPARARAVSTFGAAFGESFRLITALDPQLAEIVWLSLRVSLSAVAIATLRRAAARGGDRGRAAFPGATRCHRAAQCADGPAAGGGRPARSTCCCRAPDRSASSGCCSRRRRW